MVNRKADHFMLVEFWCPRLDLNQHDRSHRHLKTACIPISPLGQDSFIITDYGREENYSAVSSADSLAVVSSDSSAPSSNL